MNRRRLLQAVTGSLTALLSGLAASPAPAHQLRAAITTVLFNPRTARIEVMHRFYAHDAEHALALREGAAADLLGRVDDRDRFAAYVHERFALQGAGAELAPLTLAGAELDGDFLWVYQHTADAVGLTGLAVRHGALRDLWREQVNTVNVERNGQLRTLTFAGDTDWLRVDF